MAALPMSISIRFTPQSENQMELLGDVLTRLRGWRRFWQESKAKDIIAADIQRNMDQGITPEHLETWEPLAAATQRATGRSRMMFGTSSAARFAYYINPSVKTTDDRLEYAPNEAWDRAHYSYLRGGWNHRSGIYVPGREWFGMSSGTDSKLADRLTEFVFEQLERITK